MPKISIIIPIYKVEDYLRKCLDSVLAQSFQDYEAILVDDGSPDRCGKICEEYAIRDKRFKVIHKENGGLSDARNAGLEIIGGELITFIDSDDYILPNHLESLYKALTEVDADLAVANVSSVKKEKINDYFYHPSDERAILEGKDIFQTIYQPCAWAKLYKRRIFNTLRYPYGKLYEDIFIYHEVLSQVNRLVFTGQNTYRYLIREGSILHQQYKLSFTDIVDAIEARIKKLEELGLNELADENREFIYSRVAVAFANLDSKVLENKKRLEEIRDIYNREYPALIHNSINVKQRFRYWLLRRSPMLHTKLYGKRMDLTLG